MCGCLCIPTNFDHSAWLLIKMCGYLCIPTIFNHYMWLRVGHATQPIQGVNHDSNAFCAGSKNAQPVHLHVHSAVCRVFILTAMPAMQADTTWAFACVFCCLLVSSHWYMWQRVYSRVYMLHSPAPLMNVVASAPPMVASKLGQASQL